MGLRFLLRLPGFDLFDPALALLLVGAVCGAVAFGFLAPFCFAPGFQLARFDFPGALGVGVGLEAGVFAFEVLEAFLFFLLLGLGLLRQAFLDLTISFGGDTMAFLVWGALGQRGGGFEGGVISFIFGEQFVVRNVLVVDLEAHAIGPTVEGVAGSVFALGGEMLVDNLFVGQLLFFDGDAVAFVEVVEPFLAGEVGLGLANAVLLVLEGFAIAVGLVAQKKFGEESPFPGLFGLGGDVMEKELRDDFHAGIGEFGDVDVSFLDGVGSLAALDDAGDGAFLGSVLAKAADAGDGALVAELFLRERVGFFVGETFVEQPMFEFGALSLSEFVPGGV